MGAQGQDSFVQVAPDGSGKTIRNLSFDVVQSDGTIKTMQMQVVVQVDRDGRIVDSSETNRLLTAIWQELRACRQQLCMLNGETALRDETDTL